MDRTTSLTGYLRHPIQTADRWLDDITRGARYRLGYVNPAMIIAYRTYGTERQLRVRGRVVEDRSIDRAHHAKSLRHSLRVSLKRVNSDEVPGAQIEWHLHDRKGIVTI